MYYHTYVKHMMFGYQWFIFKYQEIKPQSIELINVPLTGNIIQIISKSSIKSLKVRKNFSKGYINTFALVNWNALCRILSHTRRLQKSLEYLSLEWMKTNEFFGNDTGLKVYSKKVTSEYLVSSIVSLKNLKYL